MIRVSAKIYYREIMSISNSIFTMFVFELRWRKWKEKKRNLRYCAYFLFLFFWFRLFNKMCILKDEVVCGMKREKRNY